jgi:membrane-associated phospholipid phosphatase
MNQENPVVSSLTPALPANHPALPRWRRWIIFWSVVAVALGALLSFNARLDTYLWCATRWFAGDGNDGVYTWARYHEAHAAEANPSFYMTQTPPFNSEFWRNTELFWTVCKRGGDPLWIVPLVLLAIAGLCRRRRLLACSAATGMAVAGFLGWLIRAFDGRFRPTHDNGGNHWELLRGFDWEAKNLSFPSGHATLAFAAAAALSYAFPRLRFVFIPLAALTAVARVVQQAHFWSDALMGAALGWTVAWFMMYWGDRWLEKWESAGGAQAGGPGR